jgi:LysM repeat protein
MTDTIPSPFQPAAGPRLTGVPAAATVPGTAPPKPGPAVAPTLDSIQLSAARAAAPVQDNAAIRAELTALQSDLARLGQRVEAMIARIDALPTPTTAAVTPPPPDAQVLPAAAAAGGGTHEVKAGDFLWKIAAEQLGDSSRWPELYALNKDVIGDNPNLILPGQKLRLPGRPIGQPGAPAAQPPSTSPPPFAPPSGVQPPPALPAPPPPAPQVPVAARPDVPVPASSRQLPDAEALRLAREFGLAPANAPLTPALKANVAQFLDEMAAYEGAQRGKVFGPGMEALAGNPQEAEQIRASVKQIQQALDLLLKAGKLRVADSQGRPITSLPSSGSFFQLDAQGKERKDASGNPIMDDAFVSAVTQFKQSQGIHQTYKLADGTFAINEYVGPATVEALKKALLELQQTR